MSVDVHIRSESELPSRISRWADYVADRGQMSLSRHPAWLLVLRQGLAHEPYCIEATSGGRTVGLLTLALLRSRLFGRFLVSLPYLNVGGVLADDDSIAAALVDRAVELADRQDVRYLELRHENPLEHPALTHRLTSKVHLRLELPQTSEPLWGGFKPKVRNQVRKGQKQELTVQWGGEELLGAFYDVFARNMRDLGTPVFPRSLFRAVLTRFPERAELCVVRLQRRAVAAAMLIHGDGMTEVPSASSLRPFNWTNANMLMYWQLLDRAIERRQRVFDFGRSSETSGTFAFKSQWGARPHPAVWQYYLRRGTIGDMRPDNRRYRLMIRLWKRLPVAVTRLIGPPIVRGIP